MEATKKKQMLQGCGILILVATVVFGLGILTGKWIFGS